jgi:RNA polymerase sigma factor (sigma-70 family)
MKERSRSHRSQLESAEAVPVERERLVRFCTRYTDDPGVAEDLAQQTLLEAWEHWHELRDPERRESWLFGIARNQCLLWMRSRSREVSRIMSPDNGRTELGPDGWSGDEIDLEVDLEREDLARLLDRAMALLPPETRAALIQRYIEEFPQAEIAERLGVSEGAVEARLHRGRLALRRVLTTDLREEAASYGLRVSAGDGWEETRVWCPVCGRRRLLGLFTDSEFALRCPDCDPAPDRFYARTGQMELLAGLKGYKPAYNRCMEWMDRYFRSALRFRSAPCIKCGSPAPLRPSTSESIGHYFAVECAVCGFASIASLAGLVQALPEGRRFWRENPRMRTLPESKVEVEGHPAILTTFESVSDSSRLVVVSRRDNFDVLSVHGATSIGPSKAET